MRGENDSKQSDEFQASVPVVIAVIGQTSNSKWWFLKIENVQLKTVQNNCYRQKWREATNFGVEVMNSKVQVKGKLGSVVQIQVCTEFALLTLL